MTVSFIMFLGFRGGCYSGDSVMDCYVVLRQYARRRQPTARVPSMARGTNFNGTLSELKYSNYDHIKNGIFN